MPRFDERPPSGPSAGRGWDDWDPARARSGYTGHMPAVGTAGLARALAGGAPAAAASAPGRPGTLSPAALAISARAEVEDYLTVSYDQREPGFVELYDALFVPRWSAPFGRLLLSVFLTLPRSMGWQVLDVACGTGYPTLELARFLGQDCDLAGLDGWEEAILLARRKASDEWLRNVSFLVADVVESGLPEGAFDTITCNLGLPAFADAPAALGAMWRLLRPGGHLLLTVPLQSAMREFLDTYHLTLRALKLDDYTRALGAQVGARPTIASTRQQAERAGFEVLRAATDRFTLRFPDVRAFLTSPLVQVLYLAQWRDLLPDLTIRRLVFNEIERRLGVRAAVAGGDLAMTVPMLCVHARRT